MRSHTGTVASEASPTTVRRQWFSILRALPLESNTTMREKLGSQRLLNWLPPSREKPPGAGTADFESVVRGAFRSLSGSAVAGGLPLEPGPLEKSSRGRPSDCVYERPDTNGSIRRVMALPFLPLETIAATFDSLKPEAKTEPLQQFVSYIKENWIRSTLWLPETAKLTVAWRGLPLTSREVTGAAAQRMCQYKQATDALNWTELNLDIICIYYKDFS